MLAGLGWPSPLQISRSVTCMFDRCKLPDFVPKPLLSRLKVVVLENPILILERSA